MQQRNENERAQIRHGEAARQLSVPAKETIFLEGDTAKNLYEVADGVAKIYKMMPDGRTLITGFAYRLSLLGIARAGLYYYNVDAVTDMTLVVHPRSEVEARLRDDPTYLQHLLDETNDELVQAQERILVLGRKTPLEKVSSFLTRIRQWQGEDRQLHLPMTRHDIADYLGLTTETVSRTFTQLRNQSVIASPNQHDVEIIDLAALTALAGDEEDT